MSADRFEPPPELRGVDGWHWVQYRDDTPQEAHWRHNGIWRLGREVWLPGPAYRRGYRYLSPVLTPAEAHALRAEVARLREALERISRWHGEFPYPTDELGKIRLHTDGTPMSYGWCYGSNGERDFMRGIARAALDGGEGA